LQSLITDNHGNFFFFRYKKGQGRKGIFPLSDWILQKEQEKSQLFFAIGLEKKFFGCILSNVFFS
jgi:hypothetical protein